MADNVRRIVAEFSARNKAKGVLGGFRRDLDTTGRALRRLAVGALAVAGVGGLGYMLKRQMETIDATAKLSDRLGVATEKLIGLQHAASITGTDAETLNKSLEIFTRRLGEMTQGSGEAKRGLDMLGLTAEQLIHISPAEAFGIAADKIKQLGTQAEKTAAAYYLFGRAGSKMLNMLEVGSEGLGAFQKEVEKLGLTFSRIDAAQVEAANDALTRARAVLTGLFRQTTIQLAPYIEAAATAFVNLATAGEGVGANVVNAFESISLSIVNTAEEVERLIIKLSGLISPVEHMKKLTKATEEAWKRYRQETGETMAGRYTLGPLYAPVQPKDKALFDRILAEERAGVRIEVLSRESKIRDAFENIRKKATGQPDFMTTFPEVIRFKREPFSWEKAPQEVTEKQRKAAEEIDKVWTEMWLKQEETAYHAMRAPIIAAEELARASAERRKRIAEDIALSMARSWTTAIDQMMFEGKKFWDAMIDMARGLLREIANIIMYKKVAEPIAYAFMGLPIPGGGGGGGLSGEFPTTTHGVPYIPSAQRGGEVLKTGLAVIHEGETFSGVGGGPQITEHRIINQGSEKLEISRVEEYFVSDRRIIEVTMRAMQTDIKYRRSIAQVRG